MILPLEDGFEDVLSKAQKGMGLRTEVLAARTGVGEEAIRAARRGRYDPALVTTLAEAVGLNPERVLRLGSKQWAPEAIEMGEGFASIQTPFHEGSVNAYVAWDVSTRKAIVFDTGMDGAPLVDFLKAKDLRPEAVILTHAHRDHTEGLGELRRAWSDLPVYLSPLGRAAPCLSKGMREGFSYKLGSLSVSAFDTPGHLEGSMTLLIDGLSRRVAVVGDALFAGSMGGAQQDYVLGLRSVKRILELEASMVLAPGHGPLTTVAEERVANCFADAREPV